jgi:hypothetical protein
MAVDGNWNLTMQSPMGAREVKAELTSSGNDLSGQFSGAQGSAPVKGTVNGDDVNFAASVQSPMGQLELTFAGKVEGDSMSGSVQFGSFGSGTFSGTRA